jgi:glycosyltransferase involved in cell wall biosynthesis
MRGVSEGVPGRSLPRVLHVIPGFYPAVRYGGPIESVLRTCQALRAAGVDLEVFTTDADGPGALDVATDRFVDVEGVPVRYFRRWPQTGFAFSAPLAGELVRRVRGYDLVHVSAAFSFPSTLACIVARRERVPYVVSPRGSCRPFALRQKRWKKAPYWIAIERRNLELATALHATSEPEAAELRALLPRQTVWTIPNGVDAPAYSEVTGVRATSRVVFLGRIHPVKALDRLIDAMSLVTAEVHDVELVVAGHDDDGEWGRLTRRIASLDPKPSVRYLGAVEGRQKHELLAQATLLVLPSHTENFGQVVVEALAHGTPVVASRHTPWQRLEEVGAGAWVHNDPSSLAGAILRILRDPAGRREMGQAALRLSAEFSWSKVAASLLEGYVSVVTRRERST